MTQELGILVRVFISSPGDATFERQRTIRILERPTANLPGSRALCPVPAGSSSCRFASEREAALAMAEHLEAKLRKGYDAV
jgi:hypothetical protein